MTTKDNDKKNVDRNAHRAKNNELHEKNVKQYKKNQYSKKTDHL